MGTSKSPFIIRLIDAIRLRDRFRLARYLIAGVAISIGYTVTIVAVVSWLAWAGPEAANAISLTLWTIVSYFVHRHFTFRYKGGHRDSLARFTFVFTLKMIASLLVIAGITKYAEASYLIGVFVNWLVLPMVSYIALKLWVFQQRLLHSAPRRMNGQRVSFLSLSKILLSIGKFIDNLQKSALFTTKERILWITLLVAVYLVFGFELTPVGSGVWGDTAGFLNFSPYRPPVYGIWANSIYLLSGSWHLVIMLQVAAFVAFATWVLVELALISNLGMLSALIFLVLSTQLTQLLELQYTYGALISEGLFYPMTMLTVAMFLTWVRTGRTSFLIGVVLITVGMTQVRTAALLLPAVPAFAAICALTAQAKRRSANARPAVLALATVGIGLVFMPPLLGKSVMQVGTTADSLGLVILPRVSLLPLPPVIGKRSPEWTAMSSSWRAAAEQLDISALTQFDAQLQEAIRFYLGPKILLPAILSLSPKDVDVEEEWTKGTVDSARKWKVYFTDAKRVAIEWILDEWPSYLRLSGMHLWGMLTMANLMDNGDRELVWKALNSVSVLTWRYAPRYAPIRSTYPLDHIYNLAPLSGRNNALYVLIRYSSMVVLIIGIVSAISALIQLRTNREIPRGILAIAFAVGWSIAHSIPAALLVFPEHRYTSANMLMMLAGGAAWFAYLGTDRIKPLRKSVTRGEVRMNWAGTFFFLGAAVGAIIALLGFHSAFGFIILILCFIGFIICKGSEDVANQLKAKNERDRQTEGGSKTPKYTLDPG